MAEPKYVEFSMTKLIKAPLKEAYDWLTDYRDDDPQAVTGDPWGLHVLEKTPKRVVFETEQHDKGKIYKQKTVVNLYPPNRWHAESKGNRWDFMGDYELKTKGKDTRLIVKLREAHYFQETPSVERQTAWLNKHWE